jgi:CheY-like chemotaxis protein
MTLVSEVRLVRNVLLLADNDERFRRVWGRVLSGAGYDVRLASNSQEARSVLRETRVDLAVLDLRLERDDDETDTSGLEIAADKAFRYIPKIILTAFQTSYENLRKALGLAVDDLPPVIAFVHKDEGPKALLDVIDDVLQAWPRLRMSAIRVSDQIKADYRIARLQAGLNYAIAFAISVLGFLVIFTGICLAWFNRLTVGVVGTAAGIILEAVGYLFFTRLDAANARMDVYHGELVQTYWLELLLAACEQLPSGRQEACIERAIGTATSSWLSPQQGAKPRPSVEQRDAPVRGE